MNSIHINSINVIATLVVLTFSALALASDNELWREQVSTSDGHTICAVTTAVHGESSFLDDVLDNRFQASTNVKQTVCTVTTGELDGSSFLDDVRNIHLPTIQKDKAFVEQRQRLFGSTDSVRGNWFLKAISPKTYGQES